MQKKKKRAGLFDFILLDAMRCTCSVSVYFFSSPFSDRFFPRRKKIDFFCRVGRCGTMMSLSIFVHGLSSVVEWSIAGERGGVGRREEKPTPAPTPHSPRKRGYNPRPPLSLSLSDAKMLIRR